MKHFSITIPHSISFTGMSAGILVATFLGSAAVAMAQTIPSSNLPAGLDQASLARIAADLAYPNSAQRFFEAGKAQFEANIQQLSNDNVPPDPQLTIKPEVLEQLEHFERFEHFEDN